MAEPAGNYPPVFLRLIGVNAVSALELSILSPTWLCTPQELAEAASRLHMQYLAISTAEQDRFLLKIC